MPTGNALFRTLIETAVDGVMVIDAGGTILVYNGACERLFGYRADEALGRNVKLLMPPPYHADHDDYIARYRETRERRIIGIGREVVGRRKNGTTFAMYLSVGEGELDGEPIYLGIVHDISERKEAEQRIMELQKELIHATRVTTTGQLGAALAHELNQPLGAILNNAGILEELAARMDGADAALMRDVAAKLSQQTVRAGEIIRRLRDFVAKRESDRSLQDLNAVLQESIALGFVGAAHSSISLRTQLAAGLPSVAVDRVQIQQVLINLMRNAIEAMQGAPKRVLTVSSARDDGPFLRVSVADTGPGLSDAMAATLFQPFVTTKAQGLGIGLSICRTIVEAHGGRLWVEKNERGGATFHFRLPVPEAA
jgi:two-component system sensor kinase FixL